MTFFLDPSSFPGRIDSSPARNNISSIGQRGAWHDYKIRTSAKHYLGWFSGNNAIWNLIVLIALPGIVQRIDLFWRDGFEVFSRFLGDHNGSKMILSQRNRHPEN